MNSTTTAAPPVPTPFPTIDFEAVAGLGWDWPDPPVRCHASAPLTAEPCRIETATGVSVEGELVGFNTATSTLRFRIGPVGEALALPFNKLRRLTLTTAWPRLRRNPHAPLERDPASAQERDYHVHLKDGGQLIGRTLGHMRHAAGWFFFTPDAGGGAVLRVFVPASVCTSVEFGRSAEEIASERWAGSPQELRAAVAAQRGAPLKPLGEALIDLGLVARGRLEQAMSEQGDRPLGEVLLACGDIDHADLQTAFAHKMGYPIVDLARFPIDPAAARLCSMHAMVDLRALPLMREGPRLYVAIDDLAAIPRLKTLSNLATLEIVPVLAHRSALNLALQGLPQRLGRDVWAHNVPLA